MYMRAACVLPMWLTGNVQLCGRGCGTAVGATGNGRADAVCTMWRARGHARRHGAVRCVSRSDFGRHVKRFVRAKLSQRQRVSPVAMKTITLVVLVALALLAPIAQAQEDDVDESAIDAVAVQSQLDRLLGTALVTGRVRVV